jgi:predicted O-methyltransferase YrrM
MQMIDGYWRSQVVHVVAKLGEEESTHFARTMGYLSATAALDVVANYDVSQAKNIVDVGGSHGMLLTALLQAAPTANGVLFDLPHVIEQAREVVGSLGLNDRVELRGGDFFQEVSPRGDLAMFGGRERSGQDFASLPGRAGYCVERIIPTPVLFSLIEAVRVE